MALFSALVERFGLFDGETAAYFAPLEEAILVIAFGIFFAFWRDNGQRTNASKKFGKMSPKAEFTTSHEFPRLLGRPRDVSRAPVKETSMSKSLCDGDSVEFNDNRKVLAHWDSHKNSKAFGITELLSVARALLLEDPAKLVKEVTDHMAMHSQLSSDAAMGSALVHMVATMGDLAVMESLVKAFSEKLSISTTPRMYESLVIAYSRAGQFANMERCLKQFQSVVDVVPATCYGCALRSYVRSKRLDDALFTAKEMRALGYSVPAQLVTELYHIFREGGRASEILTRALPELPPTSRAAFFLIESCLQTKDAALARAFHAKFESLGIELDCRGKMALLRLYVVCAEPGAFKVFQTMQRADCLLSEGFCVNLLTRCAESKFVRFAETLVGHIRSSAGMSLSLYGALVKVYLRTGLSEKLCEVYELMRGDSIEPDVALCGSLFRHAAECGRVDLLQELLRNLPEVSVQQWARAIRACLKAQSTDGAKAILEQALARQCKDVKLFSVALDVCAGAGDVVTSRQILSRMRAFFRPDLSAYNSVLKACAIAGNARVAGAVFSEMKAEGLEPDEASYGAVLGGTASRGGLSAALPIVVEMSEKGVAIDINAMNSLIKAVNRHDSKSDVGSVFDILDKLQIDVLLHDALLNSVLNACCTHKLNDRLGRILQRYLTEKPFIPTQMFSTLIRSAATLENADGKFDLFDVAFVAVESTLTRSRFSTMLETLSNLGFVDVAVKLVDKHKGVMLPTISNYCVLLKAFVESHRATEALALLQDLRSRERATIRAYNLVIDSLTRVGNMSQISTLLDNMRADGIEPDELTTALLIKGYCKVGKLLRAFEVFQDAKSRTGAVEVASFNTLLNGCICKNDFARADELLECLELYGVIPSNITLGTIVKLWGRRQQLDKCFDAIEKFSSSHKLVPNDATMACLVSACLLNKDLDRALAVFDAMRSGGQALEAKVFGALISACARGRRLPEALRLLEQELSASPASSIPSSGSRHTGRRSGAPRMALPDIAPEVFEELLTALQASAPPGLDVPSLFERLRSQGARVPAEFLGQA
eukprot:TRINITY_DN29233_c0_g1_i2.p1 TRINITY_DN29233_c0_g1~~TRINITY_DN29233_c0_g1_i2.p1  ORF type:complete len:1056 (+),score=154.08 TRINITY_DN29233_c0_g1_i2:205-3372(+)